MIDPAARARLDRWKHSLVDPSDRLLDVGDHGIAIAVEPVRLAFALAAGGELVIEPGVAGLDANRLRIAVPAAELSRALAALRRASRDRFADGEHALWLALGLVTRSGSDELAPLVLWPVTLDHGGGVTRLVTAPDLSPRINDALDGLPAAAELDLAALLDEAAARSGWQVARVARLGMFSFARGDLRRDLEARGDAILDAPPVAWIVGAAPPPASALTAARGTLAALDADASQLAAIAAAGAGGSFVLHGPPGTGKSQTIANLIVECASQGKSVLVVSDRAAALDVVHHRLASIGLGDFCIPLYAGHGSRARVLGALGRALDRSFRPGSGPSAGAERLDELSAALDGHVAAMHAVGLLGMSLHDALGRLVELRTTPCAMLAEADASSLDRATFERRERAVAALAGAAIAVEPVATHPWRASALDEVASPDRAIDALADTAAAVDALVAAVAAVVTLVPGLVARTPDQLRALGALGALAAASPRPGADMFANLRAARVEDVGERVALVRARGGGAVEPPRDPLGFLALATRHRSLVDEVGTCFTASIDGLDAAAPWAQLKRWTDSIAPLRFVALRAARAEVHRVARPGALATDGAMIAALEAVIAERACRAALVAAAEPARRWFGDLGGDPVALDLEPIEAAVAWASELRLAYDRVAVGGGERARQAAWRGLVAQVASAPGPNELAVFGRLADAVARWQPAVAALAAATGLDVATLGVGSDHLGALREQIVAMQETVGALPDWTRFHLARRAAVDANIGPAIAAIDRGDLDADELAGAWQRATLVAWVETELATTPALAQFRGAAHHATVAAFADLDRSALALARTRAVARLAERMPRDPCDDPELAGLRRELAATRPRSLRAVLAELPTLLPRLAPCLLATPHAVAEHLDPALPAFDVVVFDEASRLPVGHALGALARARAVIVVGDSRQPAPGDGADGLLDAALAARLPVLGLAVHHRSRHEDLFAVPNRLYYGDRLEVLPAAHAASELGVSWRRVDGEPDEAGANRAEAAAVVGELATRLADLANPAQRTRSFAVVVLSRAQQQLIEDALEAAGITEPILVGTPDRVQGEERDVVIVSVGHAADALGVLVHPGGERWLDVAITRARDQLIVMSSFAPEDVTCDAPGARDLAAVLAFARDRGRSTDDELPASPITAAIGRALAERGWIVRHRVGCGAYRIDLAVVDPNDPTRYVLAIEHDGAAYASATATRDRDRLRAQVLVQRGWRLHRIWALDWWRDAEREIQRAHGAIVTAIAAGRQRRVAPRSARGSAPVASPPPSPALASGSGPTEIVDGATTPMRLPRGALTIGPYTAAAIPAGRRIPDDMFAPRHLAELGKVVEQVLAAEAPMHVDLLARRVGAYFGVGRVTPRIADQVRVALAGRGQFGDEQGVVWRLDQDPTSVPAVRVAGSSAAARRDIAEVPLTELAAAARIVVERAGQLAATDLVRDCARLLGFARLTDRVTERIALGVRLAAARELIAIADGKARMPS